MCEGIAAEKRLRALGLTSMPLMSIEDCKAGAELRDDDAIWAVDDQTGEDLDSELVRRARIEEIHYFKAMRVYDKVSISECRAATGPGPIGVRWVDINKGDKLDPNDRSRLVAKEVRTEDRPEWFAATPPGECLKVLLSKMAADRRMRMLYADVSRAYFYAPAARPVYVRLPPEDTEEGDHGMCGRLRVSMYGTRALNLAAEYAGTLKAAGFRQGVANPCLFHKDTTNTTVMVHCDDFAAIGKEEDLKEVEKALSDKYKTKVERLGPNKQDCQEIKVFNKIIRYTSSGIELEADPCHAELIVRELNVTKCTPSRVPGGKADNNRLAKPELGPVPRGDKHIKTNPTSRSSPRTMRYEDLARRRSKQYVPFPVYLLLLLLFSVSMSNRRIPAVMSGR